MGIWSKRGACWSSPGWSQIVFKDWSDHPSGNPPHIFIEIASRKQILICIINPTDKGWNKLYQPESHIRSQCLEGRVDAYISTRLLTWCHSARDPTSSPSHKPNLSVNIFSPLSICWKVRNVWFGCSLTPKESWDHHREGVNNNFFVLHHLQDF